MKSGRKIRVLAVDDQAEMITSMSPYFALAEQVELVAQAGSGRECLDILRTRPNDIDVVLLNIRMETPTAGLEVATEVVSGTGDLRIVFLTSYTEHTHILRALRMGCSFLEKSIEVPRIINVIEEVFWRDKQIVELQT